MSAGRNGQMTADAAAIAAAYARGERVVEIAAAHGITPTRVSQIARAAGLSRQQRVAAQKRERAARMWSAGASPAAIAEMGMSFRAAKNAALRRHLHRRIAPVTEAKRRDAAFRALARQRKRILQRRRLRALLEAGRSLRQAAQSLGVSLATARRLRYEIRCLSARIDTKGGEK